jgi:hypothetical protein
LHLVATREDRPPAHIFSPEVVARSGPVPLSDTFTCYTLYAAPPLTAGEYWLWVLVRATSLTGSRFVLRP